MRDRETNDLREKNSRREVYQNAIRGCLVGGAAGDALGYPIEFLSEKEIMSRYGQPGLQSYLPAGNGKALISDDTQMTLFTANDILYASTRLALYGTGGEPSMYMKEIYGEWYRTQTTSYADYQQEKRQKSAGVKTWLTDVPELFSGRVPGNTCMSALYDLQRQQPVHNDSKGAGGVMRVAPLGLAYPDADEKSILWLAEEAAALSKVTHQHPLGYMPSAFLADLIHRIVFARENRSLPKIVRQVEKDMTKLYNGQKYLDDMLNLVKTAIELTKNNDPDTVNIQRLGEGWVAEETLAIAVYCATKYQDDFSAGIIAAVNHNGDSDTTGAVAGNILGAWVGYNAIEEKWKNDLELLPVILEISDDLCHGCRMAENSNNCDGDWTRKYVHATWKPKI